MKEQSQSPNNTNNSVWLAAYLYYNEPFTNLLVDAVYPFIEKVMNEGWAEQYFFIRYWEQGPHIRLRFKGKPQLLNEKVKPLLIKYFEAYFQESPSDLVLPEYAKNLPLEKAWYPNNSIQFIPYEPEVARYGGEVAILIAEQQFQASSKSILTLMTINQQDWGYERALGAAIQLQLGFAYQLGMDWEEIIHFFEVVFQGWLPRAYMIYGQKLSPEAEEILRNEALKAFALTYHQQKGMLLPFFNYFWTALQDENAEFEEDWLNEWLLEMRAIYRQITTAHSKGQVVFPKYPPFNENLNIPKERQARWSIYSSYVHMINNRLGILNRDEAYLGYLLINCAKDCNK